MAELGNLCTFDKGRSVIEMHLITPCLRQLFWVGFNVWVEHAVEVDAQAALQVAQLGLALKTPSCGTGGGQLCKLQPLCRADELVCPCLERQQALLGARRCM